jgi:hypothetical protein
MLQGLAQRAGERAPPTPHRSTRPAPQPRPASQPRPAPCKSPHPFCTASTTQCNSPPCSTPPPCPRSLLALVPAVTEADRAGARTAPNPALALLRVQLDRPRWARALHTFPASVTRPARRPLLPHTPHCPAVNCFPCMKALRNERANAPRPHRTAARLPPPPPLVYLPALCTVKRWGH